MIYQNTETENTQNQISYAIRELGLGKMLRKANITKNCGVPAYEVFQFLLLLVFQGKNLFRFLHSKHRDQAVSKNTYYRFLNESSYNWGRFLMLLAVKVTSAFDTLTRPERVKVLILDDTVVTLDSMLAAYYEGKQIALHRISYQKKDMVVNPQHYRRLTMKQTMDAENILLEQDKVIDLPLKSSGLSRYDEVLYE